MSATQHNRAGEVFLRARSLVGVDREDFLDRECGFDTPLREEVESLLAADGEPTDPFLGAPTSPVAGELTHAPGFLIGKTVGHYCLQRVIGAGGMGTVFEAVQERPRRKVALKMMRAGLASPTVLRRFEYESQTLALLRHPGIAQVYEAGVHETDTGPVPFFAMEFVEGARSITEYCRAKELNIKAKLELFASVCEAVEHAHRNGVIHRDLKPENVVVDLSGRPKVIDFGIARIVQNEDQHRTLHTTAGEVLGTLPYLSPEQAAGDSKLVDTRTDVYGLGIILYQLVTGQFPYDVDGNLGRAIRQILDAEPTSPRLHNPLVEEDVETIIRKSLQKDRDRRYQSAGQLGQDIEHFLLGEAIEARRDSGWYMLRKTVRRYRVAVCTTAAFLILTAAATVALSFLYSSQRTQRQRAEVASVIARNASEEAQSARSLAELRAEQAERHAYIAGITAANHAIANNDAGDAIKRLASTPPHLRHWEWRHLEGRADLSQATLPAVEPAIHVAFHPKEDALAIGYRSGNVRAWSLSEERYIWERALWEKEIHVIEYSTNGDLILASPGGHSWCVLDAATGNEVRRFETGHADGHALAFNSDGTRVAFHVHKNDLPPPAGAIGVSVYDATTGKPVQQWSFGDQQPEYTAVFDSQGELLATGDAAGTVRVRALDSMRPLFTSENRDDRVYTIAFHPDGAQLASGHESGDIQLWNVATGAPEAMLRGHSQRAWQVAYNRQGTRLASASRDKTVRIWDLQNQSTAGILRGHALAVTDVCWSPDGKRLATASSDGTVKLWPANATEGVIAVRPMDQVEWLTFDQTGARLLTANSVDFTIWDARTGQPLQRRQGHRWSTGLQCAVFSRDENMIFVGTRDGYIRALDAASFTVRREFGSHEAVVRAIAVSPDESLLASGSEDGRIILWDVQSGTQRRSLMGNPGEVQPLAFHPDGSRLAFASPDGMVRVWDLEAGQCAITYAGHQAGVYTVAFRPDKDQAASASHDGTFHIWNATTGEAIRKVDGGMQDLWGIAYSPDGRRLVTGARDMTVRIWDADTGDELLTLRGPTGTVMRVAWSPDGNRIAAGSWNRELFIWSADLKPDVARDSPSPAVGDP